MEKPAMKSQEENPWQREGGFTLVETLVSLIIAMISVLGAISLFTYAVNYNSGASGRAMALTIAQQRMEQMRSLAFSDLDSTEEVDTENQVKGADHEFTVSTHVCDGSNHDDNLCKDGAGAVNCSASPTMKAVTIRVAPSSPNAEWARDTVTVRAYRASSLMGYN
jgi:type IV pilus modification protein PilV